MMRKTEFDKSELDLAIEILDSLEEAPTRSDKLQILESNKFNQTLKAMFWLTYNPYNHYAVDMTLDMTPKDKRRTSNFSEFYHVLVSINRREIEREGAQVAIASVLAKCEHDEMFWYKRVLSRDLGCGVSVDTINSVWPELIRPFRYQKATYLGHSCAFDVDYSSQSFALSGIPVGTHVFVFLREDGSIDKVITGNGRLFDNTGEINDLIQSINPKIRSKVVEGYLNQKQFTVVDCINLDDFHNGQSEVQYRDRLPKFKKSSPNIYIIDWTPIKSTGDSQRYLVSNRDQCRFFLRDMDAGWSVKSDTNSFYFDNSENRIGCVNSTVSCKRKLGLIDRDALRFLADELLARFIIPQDVRDQVVNSTKADWPNVLVDSIVVSMLRSDDESEVIHGLTDEESICYTMCSEYLVGRKVFIRGQRCFNGIHTFTSFDGWFDGSNLASVGVA